MIEPLDRGGRFFFRPTATFETAFPTLDDARVEFIEHGKGGAEDETADLLEKKSVRLKGFGGAIKCSDPECHGGYDIDSLVHEMIRTGEIVKDGRKRCDGTRGTPKLGKVYGPCINSIEYRIELIRKK
jgi:hypothetical protein